MNDFTSDELRFLHSAANLKIAQMQARIEPNVTAQYARIAEAKAVLAKIEKLLGL